MHEEGSARARDAEERVDRCTEPRSARAGELSECDTRAFALSCSSSAPAAAAAKVPAPPPQIRRGGVINEALQQTTRGASGECVADQD